MQRSPNSGARWMGTSSPTILCSLGSVVMAKGIRMSHEPGQQHTPFPGRREPPGPCLPAVVQERAAPDQVSPFSVVPVSRSLLSGVVPLSSLHTWFPAESRHLNAGAAPSYPMASCTHCADYNGQEPEAGCVLPPGSSLESCHCGHQGQEPSPSSTWSF